MKKKTNKNINSEREGRGSNSKIVLFQTLNSFESLKQNTELKSKENIIKNNVLNIKSNNK